MVELFVASLLAAVLASTGIERAPVLAAGAWTSHGPEGALYLYADPRAPRSVFAATGEGLFESVDAGVSWTPRGSGLSALPVTLVFGPADDPPAIYGWSVTEASRSFDGGITWATLPGRRRVLAVDPTSSQRVFSQGSTLTTPCSLDVSTDGGVTWRAVFECAPEAAIAAVAFDPQDPRNVYAGVDGTSQFHVYKSVDAGETWFPSDQGETDVVSGLVVDPGDPRVVYAFAGRAIFKTADGAATWTAANPLPPILEINSLAVDPSDGSVYAATYNGLFRSVGAEAPWELVSPLELFALTIFEDPDALFLAQSFDGILRSSDRGASWTEANAGLHGASVATLALDPSGSLFAAAVSKVFESDDGGRSWSGRPYAFPHRSQIWELVAAPAPSVLYAGTSGDGVQVSRDGGGSWVLLGLGLTSTAITSLARTPSGTLVAGGSSGVYRMNAYGVWETHDEGLTSRVITKLVAAPSNDGVIYAGTSLGGVFRSTNAGGDWSPAGLDGSYVTDLAVDPNDDRVLYVSAAPPNEYPLLVKSTDAGQTWSLLAGLLEVNGVGCLAVDPSNSRIVYGCTEFGLFRSTDGGLSWSPFDQGVPRYSSVTRVLIEPDGKRLHAATGAAGVLDRVLGGRAPRTLESR